MKVSLPILLFSILFLFVGCREGEAAGIGSTTAVSQLTVPTETSVPPTATTPTPSPTPPPPPTGQIIYFWDPEYPLDNYGIEPSQSLYLAQPGNSPTDWSITPILNDLVGLPRAALSPDQSKLALTVLEDRNSDGVISFGSYQRGGDAYNLYNQWC